MRKDLLIASIKNHPCVDGLNEGLFRAVLDNLSFNDGVAYEEIPKIVQKMGKGSRCDLFSLMYLLNNRKFNGTVSPLLKGKHPFLEMILEDERLVRFINSCGVEFSLVGKLERYTTSGNGRYRVHASQPITPRSL